MNPDLQAFVRDALARGIARERIRTALAQAGWPGEEVEAALAAWADTDLPVPVPRRRPYLSAREAFLYLVVFATLYITAFNTGLVLFGLVDRFLPDPLRPYSGGRAEDEAVRAGVAGLLIAFPVFLLVTRWVERGVRAEPEARASKVRKWLTYLTLFAAALLIIGDLTFLVQRLLAGDLPLRVLLKTAVVFLIAGVVFVHYLTALRGEERSAGLPAHPSLAAALAARLAPLFVALTAVAGFIAIGTPHAARARFQDVQRVTDLRALWSQLEADRREGRALPASLEELRRRPPVSGSLTLRDRVTQEPYGYRVVDSLTIELCARFDAADSLAPEGYPDPSSWWKHGRGRSCFTLALAPRPRGIEPPPGPR